MKHWFRERFTPNLPLGGNGKRVTACREHINVSREAAEEGMVLLKNEDGVLPLARESRIALFGKATIDYVKGGGGSGDVTVPYIRTIADGFEELGEAEVFPDTVTFYRDYVAKAYASGGEPGLIREPELPSELLDKAAAFTDTAVVSVSRFSGEGWDRTSEKDSESSHRGIEHNDLLQKQGEVFQRGDFYLSDEEEAMLQKVEERFPHVIVVLNVGSIVDTARYQNDPKIQSVLMAWQGGMEGGTAEARILMGDVNPSGRLADTFAMHLSDYPAADTFYDSDEYVDYFEDIYVGYRYFETIPGAAEKVIYPFGYGLSYTTFAFLHPEIARKDDEISVRVTVKNTGDRPGKEVAQLYLSAPQGVLGKPARELAAYQKTKLLAPGEEERLLMTFRLSDHASYDDLGKVQKSAYILEKGEYRLLLGTNVREARDISGLSGHASVFVLDENKIVKQVHTACAPEALGKRLCADGSYEDLPLIRKEERNNPNADALERLPENELEYPMPAVRALPRRQYFQENPNPQLADVADGKISLEAFIQALSDEDLAYLAGGQPNTGVSNTFGIGNNPLYGIPNVMTEDGPAGLRVNEDTGIRTTAFPVATLLACTWNPDVTYAVGAAGAEEVKENNIGVWLTPAVNIHRTPLCGRNFEYYSEDPVLVAGQAGAMIRGIQSQKIAASVKHFAANNKETNRKNSDSRVSERALREIYLKAFQLIIRDADPWAVMTSYNIINGHRASENRELLKDILRDEWKYEGMVTSDWWNYAEHYKEVRAGNDLRMPCGYPERLLKALEIGEISRADLELAAKHILGLILKLA